MVVITARNKQTDTEQKLEGSISDMVDAIFLLQGEWSLHLNDDRIFWWSSNFAPPHATARQASDNWTYVYNLIKRLIKERQ